jgi:Fe-S-cluster containining protein
VVTTPPYARTSCACADCQACCREQPGSLAPGELEAIAAHLDKPVAAVLAKFWASPGALLMHAATGATFRQGTITPKLARGRCVFLDANDRCTIHAVAPYGCRMFDTHMPATEAQPRSIWLARAQADPAYQSLRRTLAPAARYRPRRY